MQKGPLIFSRLAPAIPTPVFDTYWRFAAERQEIFFRRLGGDTRPWTTDPILGAYKFTNAYRASDRVSQYLIRAVIYSGPQAPEDVFFRTLLFKLFNKIATWQLLEADLGEISCASYSFERYDRVLSTALARGSRIYSGAYIMPAAKGISADSRKHRTHLRLLERMTADGLPRQIQQAPSMQIVYDLLKTYPSIGAFLAYQFATDLNYSELINFSELDFVVPGPGARDGIRKCFSSLGGLTETEIIRFTADTQQVEFSRLGVSFRNLWGRALQLIDCQNLYCEVDKYSRQRHPEFKGISGRTRIKQQFRPSTSLQSVWYPPKWGINKHVSQSLARRSS